MKRRIALLLIAAWMCFFATSACAVTAGDVLCVANCESWVSLRQAPQKDSKRIEKLPKGTAVIVDSMSTNGFCKVKYGNTAGYILAQYLEEQSLAMRVGNCSRYVTMREQPSTSAEEMTKINKGELVLRVSVADNGFFRVFYNGKIGYVLSKYLLGATLSDGTARYVANCQSFISHRNAPSTKATRFQKIPLNAQVISFGQVIDGMEYVYYGGKYGFVASNYLSSLPDSSTSIARATLNIDEQHGAKMSQIITDSTSLLKLQNMIRNATASDLGQCPLSGYLTLQMEDGGTVRFLRATDGCPQIVAENGAVLSLSEKDSREFWKIFDKAWSAIMQ